LHELDVKLTGFEWIDCNDSHQSVIAFLRKGLRADDDVLVVFNFTPVPRDNYRIGVPSGGFWRELLNSDGREYGGSGVGNLGGVLARPEEVHGRPYSLPLTIPPLGVVFFRKE
jgi:1,4-alpha-glucan branching enzyme